MFFAMRSFTDFDVFFGGFRELKREKKDIRLAISPLLQAEEDARFVADVRLLTLIFISHVFFHCNYLGCWMDGMVSNLLDVFLYVYVCACALTMLAY